MPSPKKKPAPPPLSIDDVKRATITAMFSDDELLELLVLKGGNALDFIHKLSTRASVDLDFSIRDGLPEEMPEFCQRVERSLLRTFQPLEFHVFDVKMEERPEIISEELAAFWGGYAIEFKLIAADLFAQFGHNLAELRKRALSLGQGTKFLIDISRYEYIDGKQAVEFDGYRIYVYSAEMIVCEKLRALCQQTPEYSEIVKRGRAGAARARDFVDIHVLMDSLKLDLTTDRNVDLMRRMFDAKRVPLKFLGLLVQHRDFHKTEFASVQATVKPGVELRSFDFYFDFVLGLVEKLKPSWDV